MDRSSEIIGHLEELRKRLILVAAWFLLALIGGLYVSPAILNAVKDSPAALSFHWNVFALPDGLAIYMKCAVLFAVLLTLPLLLYQLWAFVRPGLSEQEAKGTLIYVPASFALFLSGAAFGYTVVLPMMIRFMQTINRSIGAAETYGIDRFFGLVFNVVFPLGIAFELPLLVLFLTRLGLLTPENLRKTRKYTYIGLAIVGASISPPDFFSHIAVTIPLIALFECSILLSARYVRRMNLSAGTS
ncbi:twin-arginine translocase subunit TatC [Paenibacillus chitinolyticus]|uniref:twin-arginine translocase subunit TatC n=1 Tax=Paenibacillus chitinolyticus TaxID=79263 RepID=UPI001C43DD9A|nr:twin-arginine translocase subunit TatC [Paenibacillus chitinolyticus]MBV6714920.1 twin-arginine translocase subunit TatC [Paenibacillus chitinolyticus]